MKKILITLLVIIGLFIGALAAIPFFFKDKIAAAVQEQIDATLNAKVHFSTDNLSLSMFTHFPDVTADIYEFAISGKGVFEKDTLMYVKDFSLTLDVASVFSGEQIEIKAVDLIEPKINVLVLADSSANYDIVKETGEEEVVEEEATGETPVIKIHGWSITDGELFYSDATFPMEVSLKGLNHQGSGNFEQAVFDMVTKTEIASMSINYDGIQCMSEAKGIAEVTMGMNLDSMKFTFKDNYAKVNDFTAYAEGWLAMPENDIPMDIRFHSKDNNFKSLLSLVPGMYQNHFDELKAKGDFHFDGRIHGAMTETLIPQFDIQLHLKDGFFQYEGLPSAVEKVGVDLVLKNTDGITDHTLVDMSKFHLEVENNPVHGSFRFSNMDKYELALNGKIDLETVQHIYPLDSTTLKGVIDSQLKVEGLLSDETNVSVKANGAMGINDLYFQNNDLPQGFGIAAAKVKLTPEKVQLENYQGTLGKSDMNVTGSIYNYMGFALKDEVLKGNLTYQGKVLDLNEWMSEEEEEVVAEETPTDTTAMEIVAIPQNLDLTFDAKINKVLFTDVPMDNLVGKMTVKDGIVKLNKVSMNTLGGRVTTSGAYDTKNPEDPRFDFNFDASQLAFGEAYKNVSTIQKYAPIAENMQGDFSTGMRLSGKINPDFSPDLNSIVGGGLLKVTKAAIKDVQTLNTISSLAKVKELKDPEVKGIAANFHIEDGKLLVDPFSFTMGGIPTNVSGYNTLEGQLDYLVKMDVSKTSMSKLGITKADFKVSGNYDDPKVTPMMSKAAQEKVDKVKEEATKEVKDATKSVVDDVKKGDIDGAKKKVEENKEKGKKLINNLWKKK
ncbi:AsmA-like C-terminal region-containing protein [Algivirga pacifica]|uniref:AsmA-like C-terminal region-containing protein n=1 Tax=Algivirga pacifica TaxID=1162670 RepID=A0ABP9D5F2_9BACT